jgi:hypothetical protein
MFKGMRALLAAGVVALAAVGSFGFGYEGRFDGIAEMISGSVAEGDASALKIQRFIEKESGGLYDDLNTLSKVAKEAAKSGVISEEYLWELFGEMTFDGTDEMAETFADFGNFIISHPQFIRKHAAYIAKSAKGLLKYTDYVESEDNTLSKAAKFYAVYFKLASIMRNLMNKFAG